MTKFFRVRDFEKQQHYKTRTPPWIKLYNGLLDDYAFAHLPDSSKAHLLCICLLASRHGNRIPFDSVWVARRINATGRVDLAVLEKEGFIIVEEDASAMLAGFEQDACPEREGEKEKEEEKEILSDKSDLIVPEIKSVRKTYPEAFETFWRNYPTDALMSKVKAHAAWLKLSAQDQAKARAAIPAFKTYCARNVTYRAVHACRFLSERRFDGFSAAPGGAPDSDLARIRDEERKNLERMGLQ